MIFSIAAFVIGLLLLCAGIYYLGREKRDPESRKIYAVTAAASAVIAVGTAVKIAVFGL